MFIDINDKNDFLKKSIEILDGIFDLVTKAPEMHLESLVEEETTLIIVDMVNGFAREGALKSPRVESLIPEITRLSRKCGELNIPKLALADCHAEASPEFDSYPAHCIADSSEGEIVDEIKVVGGYTLITKNSTNGFLEKSFQEWLEKNQSVDTFIITGDCTDICVQQFAITLKAWFNMNNRRVRVIVPLNAVETYDLALHNGDLMNLMAIYNMIINGIEVVAAIK